jgi:hypothetical protein
MQLTIRQLRKIIHEEVDRCVQRSAGFTGGANVGSGVYNEVNPLDDGEINDEAGDQKTIGNNENGELQAKAKPGM